MNVLDTRGFEQYTLSELSVAEQVRLFSNAEAVVSSHGAGLSNIVYSDSPVIVELFGEKKKTTYYRLAELLGHDYYPLHNEEHRQDLVVDVDKLERKLAQVL